MTKRRRLSQRDFVAMLLAQGAQIPCGCGCGEMITDPDNIEREHLNELEISRDDSIANQQLWRKHPCSHLKTNGTKVTTLGSSKHVIAKMKRLTGQTKQGPKRKIQSRGFQNGRNGPFRSPMNGKTERRADG